MSKGLYTKCPPQPISNDEWTPEAAAELKARVDQEADPRTRAAVVIGGSALQYLLPWLNVGTVMQVNPNGHEVFGWAHAQRARFAQYEDWPEYHSSSLADIRKRGTTSSYLSVFNYGFENLRAEESGLQGDYATARRVAANTTLITYNYDLLTAAPIIARDAKRLGLAVAALNFTNVACWVDVKPNGNAGRQSVGVGKIIEGFLGVLPLDTNAVIIDSSKSGERGLLEPEIYTPQNYHTAARRVG